MNKSLLGEIQKQDINKIPKDIMGFFEQHFINKENNKEIIIRGFPVYHRLDIIKNNTRVRMILDNDFLTAFIEKHETQGYIMTFACWEGFFQ